MTRSVRCPCYGNPACKLCTGTKFYDYQPDDRGWQLFRCPTCRDAADRRGCVTCRGAAWVDPANPPFAPGWKGDLRSAWKVIFGGG
jgi:hypothetical protein